MILFGYEFEDKVFHKIDKGNRLFTSEKLNKIWGHGYCVIGNVTFESAAYVARYITKKITGEKKQEHYDGRQEEYATMSLKPAIGKKHFEKYKTDMYNHDMVIRDGHKMRPPKYYDKLMDELYKKEMERIKYRRKKQLVEIDPERLLTMEKIKKIQTRELKRGYEW